MKINAHSETMSVAQAGKMIAFIDAAIRSAPEFKSRGGARMKRPAILWINGEKFAIASSGVDGSGDTIGPVAVSFTDDGESASLAFAPYRGPEAIFGLKRL